MGKYGKITAIGIEEIPNGSWIQRIRARYGREEEGWSQWRKVGPQSQYGKPRIHEVELTSSTHLSSYCTNNYGSLYSLVVTNLDDGTQQVFGNHEKHNGNFSLRELPPLDQSSLALTHLYG